MLLRRNDNTQHHAIAMATDGNSMYYLLVGFDSPPLWVADNEVEGSHMGSMVMRSR